MLQVLGHVFCCFLLNPTHIQGSEKKNKSSRAQCLDHLHKSFQKLRAREGTRICAEIGILSANLSRRLCFVAFFSFFRITLMFFSSTRITTRDMRASCNHNARVCRDQSYKLQGVLLMENAWYCLRCGYWQKYQIEDDKVESADDTICSNAFRQAKVLPNFVHSVVVTATVGHSNRIKVAVVQHRWHRVLPASAAVVYAHATRKVELRKLLFGCAKPCNVIWCATVLDVLPAHIVEGLASPVCSHSVDLNDWKMKTYEISKWRTLKQLILVQSSNQKVTNLKIPSAKIIVSIQCTMDLNTRKLPTNVPRELSDHSQRTFSTPLALHCDTTAVAQVWKNMYTLGMSHWAQDGVMRWVHLKLKIPRSMHIKFCECGIDFQHNDVGLPKFDEKYHDMATGCGAGVIK